MTHSLLGRLTRRERHIMDILFRMGRATADDVMSQLSGKPTSSTVRTQLRVLEAKGHVRHEEVGRRFVYMPVAQRASVRRSALRHLIDTFFDGSTEKVVAALVGGDVTRLTADELTRIASLIDTAKKGETK